MANGPHGEVPIAVIQTDVGFANTFRLEFLKQLLTIATALLAFTVAFFTSAPACCAAAAAPAKPSYAYLAWIGWIGLIVSIVLGVYQLRAWELFYISYRDYDHRGDFDGGKNYRKPITRARRNAMAAQFVALIVGVVFVAIFAAIRISS